MNQALICAAARTAIGSLNGTLASVSAVKLGQAAAAAALARSGLAPEAIDETLFGNVLQAGLGQNPARQIAIGCGVPVGSPACTVNQVCGSGMQAVLQALRAIRLGEAAAVLAGGAESMSGAPFLLPALRQGAGYGRTVALDSTESDGLTDAFSQAHMGLTAENIAAHYAIGREAQDAYAAESQRRCATAVAEGRFETEIVPVTVRQRKSETVVARDEHPRPDTTPAVLARLRPAFKPDGTVTAGNASGINDGAAALVIAERSRLTDTSGCVILRDAVCTGCPPDMMGMGPVDAVRRLLQRQGLQTGDIDLWELNEAFAVQSLAVLAELGLDPVNVNVNGGAIALGHPIGASGARIIVTLIHQMKRQGAALGVASLCVGGGMGVAVLLENI